MRLHATGTNVLTVLEHTVCVNAASVAVIRVNEVMPFSGGGATALIVPADVLISPVADCAPAEVRTVVEGHVRAVGNAAAFTPGDECFFTGKGGIECPYFDGASGIGAR